MSFLDPLNAKSFGDILHGFSSTLRVTFHGFLRGFDINYITNHLVDGFLLYFGYFPFLSVVIFNWRVRRIALYWKLLVGLG